jgi:hypothetical protein
MRLTNSGQFKPSSFGTGISAATNSLVTVNGPVTGDGLGLSASSGARIVANGINLGNVAEVAR